MAAAPAYLGPLGGMGLTAYAGLIDAAQLRAGDVVWVSAAAGAVGSLAAQIAKLRGHRVIGSAGSDEKVRHLLDDLGSTPPSTTAAGPSSSCCARRRPTGSTSTSTASAATTSRPRSTACAGGAASRCAARCRSTRATEPTAGPRNLFQATANDLTLRGFRGSSHLHRMDEVARELGGWLADGPPALPPDDRRRPRARAGGARADAGRRHGRQDAGAHRRRRA